MPFTKPVAINIASILFLFLLCSSTTQAQNCFALDFDGSNDHVVAPPSVALNSAATQYTVELWFKPEGRRATWTGIVGKPGRNYNIWLHGNGFIHHRFHTTASYNQGAPNTAPGTITWNEWNHVAITNDGSVAQTFINGVLETSGPVNGALVADNTPLIIGKDLDGINSRRWSFFLGQMDEVRIWNVVRSATEIAENMSVQMRGKEPGLVANYSFEEGSGLTAGDNAGSHTGALTNMDNADWVAGNVCNPVIPIPTISQWGLIFLFLGLLGTGGAWLLRIQRRGAPAYI